MSMESYRLEVREREGEGIDADVYGEDDLVEASTRVSYEDYDLEPSSRSEAPHLEAEVTADVTTVQVQYERDPGGFTFRLLGDREELTTLRVDDEEWDLG